MPAGEDNRKAHLLRIASHYFGVQLSSDEKLTSDQQQCLSRFLDSGCLLLVMSRKDAKGAVLFTNDVRRLGFGDCQTCLISVEAVKTSTEGKSANCAGL